MRMLSGEPLEVTSEDDWLHIDGGRDLRNNFSLPVNYRSLTHVVGGQITKY